MLYHLGYLLKKRLATARSKALPHRVISVGNITTGGTGKTPIVIALAERARQRGLFPIILTRGYRGKTKGPCFVMTNVSNHGTIQFRDLFCCNTHQAGDEAILMSMRLPKTPIVKSLRRYTGGVFAMNNLDHFCRIVGINKPDGDTIVFLMDDGFQHWYLKRDLDIVLIDGLNPFGNERLLPFGILREPLSSLRRADCLVITRQENLRLLNRLKAINPEASVFYAHFHPTALVDSQGMLYPCDALLGKRVFAFSAIGNPQSFLKTLESLKPSEVYTENLRDHHRYQLKDLLRIKKKADASGCDMIVTTEKDLVKIAELSPPFEVFALRIEAELSEDLVNFVFKP